MWHFHKIKKLSIAECLNGISDYHTHILPNVDDGVTCMEHALKILKTYEEWNIREVWLTPHIMEDYPNTTDSLCEKFITLKAAYSEVCGQKPIMLHLGAENMLDSLFVERLANKDLLTIIDDRHLLVETSYYNQPLMFNELLNRIIQNGYIAVLAHPERYHYMDMQDYVTLRNKGILMQLDITSLAGEFGEEAQRKALILLKKGLYSLAGTDLHSLHNIEEWTQQPIEHTVKQQLQLLNQYQKENMYE